jgi:methionine sulfoxide reductase heme-binding subunit
MEALWYASRGTGLVSLLLLTATVVLGALFTARFSRPRWPRFTVAAVHRNLSLTTLVFLAIHVATAVIDPYAGIRWLDGVLPFGSVYRPLWTGLGAVAADLLLALVVSSLLRLRLSARVWRGVHWVAYACWPVAVVHGLGIGGADTRLGWVLLLYAGCGLAVAAAVGWRLTASHPDTVARAAGLPERW